MPSTEEIAAASAAAGDTLAVVLPTVTASPAVSPATGGKKRKAAPMRMATGGSVGAGAAAAAKATQKTVKPQHNHPPYGSMIKAALQAMQDKKGSSRAAILKYIMQNYEVGENPTLVNAHLRLGLKRGVASGTLKQMKGTGASGSFRLADAKTEPVKRAKKPMAKKTAAAGDVKAPAPKKTRKPKSAAKKTSAPKASKPRAAPKKKTATTAAPVAGTAAAGAAAGGGGGTTAKKNKARSTKKVRGTPSAVKSKMAKKPAAAAHARSKKVAAA